MPICNPKSTAACFILRSPHLLNGGLLFWKQIEIFCSYVLKEMYRSESESEEWVDIHFYVNKDQKCSLKIVIFGFIISAIEGTLEFINPFYRRAKWDPASQMTYLMIGPG